MRRNLNNLLCACGLVATAAGLTGCGGGIPVRIRIDEFKMELSIDDLIDQALGSFKSQGLFPAETAALPVLWPASLPAIKYRASLAAPPVPINLSSSSDPKYEMVNKATAVLRRIELNRLMMRVEQSSLTIGLPELRLQVADKFDADPDDRLAWEYVGRLPASAPGYVGDVEFEFAPGGETFLNSQFAEKEKQFAMRVVGNIELDTTTNPRLPAGAASVRMIVVATFFVDPEAAIGAAGDLANAAK
jgi:hypothetical protein